MKSRFQVIFHNQLSSPIDLYWVDYEGRKNRYSKNVNPGTSRGENTSFTHPWVFKKARELWGSTAGFVRIE